MKDKKILLHKFTSLFLALIMLFQIPLGSLNIFALEDGNQSSTENTESTKTSEAFTSNTETISTKENSTEITASENESSEIKNNNIILQNTSTDEWKLNTVFYDSSANDPNEPLTEINWIASDGSYLAGTPRVIKVQINYENTNPEKVYKPGELQIKIPNLIYGKTEAIWNSELGKYEYDYYGTNIDAQWDASVTVTANDSTHSGLEWNFITANAPSRSQEYLTFSNAIEMGSTNFKGYIQITYTITPAEEYKSNIEQFEDECTHRYSTSLEAELSYPLAEVLTTITSPNYPEAYPKNMTIDQYYWEYTLEDSGNLSILFSNDSFVENNCDYIYVYDKEGNELYKLTGTAMAGLSYPIKSNYIKIAMKSDGSVQKTGFSAIVQECKTIKSNSLQFDYTRTYTHPWEKANFSISQIAETIKSLDNLPSNDYYWVKYTFIIQADVNSDRSEYPYIDYDYSIFDYVPPNCVVFDQDFNNLSHENGHITATNFSYDTFDYCQGNIYVGYPKNEYSEAAGNLTQTNNIDLNIKYKTDDDYFLADQASATINLSDFEFEYSGELYTITKGIYDRAIKTCSTQLLDKTFDHYCSLCSHGHVSNQINWSYNISAVYQGTPLTVRFGDDLLFITDSESNYRKLNENEYYFPNVWCIFRKN